MSARACEMCTTSCFEIDLVDLDYFEQVLGQEILRREATTTYGANISGFNSSLQQMYVNSQYVVNLKTRLDTIATKNGSAIVCHCEFCDHGMQKYYSFCSVHCNVGM